MQDVIKLNDIVIEQPNEYGISLATTSTEDSDRTQDLIMHNTPMGTIGSYSLKWEYIKVSKASEILRQVINKPSFKVHYFDMYYGAWKDAYFYASNFEITPLTLEDGYEMVDEMSFNIVGINPI